MYFLKVYQHTSYASHYLHTPFSDNTLRIWDTETAECTNVLRGHKSRIWDVSSTKLGDYVASASGDGTVKVRKQQPSAMVTTRQFQSTY